MPNLPSLEEMLKAGVHFGHQKSKWHPKMAPFIFTEKNKILIINLEETRKQLATALSFISELAAKGGVVLFLGTKRQAQEIIRDAAVSCGMPYITQHWLGGTFTNAKSVLGLVKNYRRLKFEKESGELDRYTKKERLSIERKIAKLDKVVGGLENLNRVPDAVFIVDIKNEKTALVESNLTGVPVVAMCDTNVNPSKVDYVIPANDDAVKSIKMVVGLVAEAVNEGKKSVATKVEKEVK